MLRYSNAFPFQPIKKEDCSHKPFKTPMLDAWTISASGDLFRHFQNFRRDCKLGAENDFVRLRERSGGK